MMANEETSVSRVADREKLPLLLDKARQFVRKLKPTSQNYGRQALNAERPTLNDSTSSEETIWSLIH